MATLLAQLAKDHSTTSCSFEYLTKSDLYATEKPYYFSGELEKDQESLRTNLTYTTHHDIRLHDLRGSEKHLSLDTHGFQLLNHESLLSMEDPDDATLQAYLKEVSLVLKDKLDAEKVLCYSYRVCSVCSMC